MIRSLISLIYDSLSSVSLDSDSNLNHTCFFSSFVPRCFHIVFVNLPNNTSLSVEKNLLYGIILIF